MIIVFAHDHVFSFTNSGRYYSDGKLTSKSWQRYLDHCDQLFVVSRAKPVNDEESAGSLDLSSAERVVFHPLRGLSQFSALFFNFFHNFFLVKKMVKQSDLVVLRVPSFVSLLFLISMLSSRKKYCVEVVASANESLSAAYGRLGGVLGWLLELITKVVVRHASGAIYVTQSFLQQKYPNSRKTAVASNLELKPVSGDVIARRVRFIDSGRCKKLGLIGSYTQRYKGIDLAIELVHMMVLAGYDVALEVVGKGDSEDLRQLAISLDVQDRVSFLGTLPSGYEVYHWLDGVDIYLQPSRTEGLPRSVVEAMSRGCPVVASKVGGIPELIDANFLHERDDINEMFRLVKSFVDDRGLMKEQAHKNFIKASLYYSTYLEKVRSEFFSSILGEL